MTTPTHPIDDGTVLKRSDVRRAAGGEPATRIALPDEDRTRRAPWLRTIGLLIMAAVFMAAPIGDVLSQGDDPVLDGLQIIGLLVLFGLLIVVANGQDKITSLPLMWIWLVPVLLIGVTLPLSGGPAWVGATSIATALVGRFAPPRLTLVIVILLVVYTAALPFIWGTDLSLMMFALLPVAGAIFPYQTYKRMRVIRQLRETRAELARAAVAEERLRIARDLHDLLGHSLSVITLKSELAGRMIDADPRRARTEIAELEAVARRSLSEVRQAVTDYRRPTLDGELVDARRVLTAADIEPRVEAPMTRELPADVDTLLAWVVREGTTNVVRHSDARHCAITLTRGRAATMVLHDDGHPDRHGAAPERGSGLTGIAERAAELGGTLEAGVPAGSRGFRLRVVIPLEET